MKITNIAKLQAQTKWLVADYSDCSFCNNCSEHTQTELNKDLDVSICKCCLAVKQIEVIRELV